MTLDINLISLFSSYPDAQNLECNNNHNPAQTNTNNLNCHNHSKVDCDGPCDAPNVLFNIHHNQKTHDHDKKFFSYVTVLIDADAETPIDAANPNAILNL